MRGHQLVLDMKQYATEQDCLCQHIKAKYKYPNNEGLDNTVLRLMQLGPCILAALVPMILLNNDRGEYKLVHDQESDFDSNSIIDSDPLGSESP